MINDKFFRFCALFSSAIPSEQPYSTPPRSVSGYEGESMQFQCSLRILGDPPVRWSWFCGQDQMTSGISYSTTYTYLTFQLSMQYHLRSCYCRATSPSSILAYNWSSDHRLINVHRMWELLLILCYNDKSMQFSITIYASILLCKM